MLNSLLVFSVVSTKTSVAISNINQVKVTETQKLLLLHFDALSVFCQGEEESFILKSCTRRKTDSIEKRFCFDVEAVDRSVISLHVSPVHIVDLNHVTVSFSNVYPGILCLAFPPAEVSSENIFDNVSYTQLKLSFSQASLHPL